MALDIQPLNICSVIRLPTLKLDRSFIAPMMDSEQSYEIVSSSIGLAHSLGMSVVAEELKPGMLEDKLMQLGCEYGQGWYFGKPSALEKLNISV